METSSKLPPERDEHGRLLPGRQSINPHGRPKKRDSKSRGDRLDVALEDASVLPPEMQYPKQDPNRDPVTGKFVKGNTAAVPDKLLEGGAVKTERAAKQFIMSRLGDILQRVVDDALAGDSTAQKLLVDKCLPSLKSVENTNINFDALPRMTVNVPRPESEPIDVEVVEDNAA